MSSPTLDRIACHGNRRYPVYERNGKAVAVREDEPNWITCADGYELSVIAGWGAYCSPRWDFTVDDDYPGPYTAVEVMLHAPEIEAWAEYEAGGVYSCVPVEMVREVIESHGGEVSSRSRFAKDDAEVVR